MGKKVSDPLCSLLIRRGTEGLSEAQSPWTPRRRETSRLRAETEKLHVRAAGHRSGGCVCDRPQLRMEPELLAPFS